MNSLAKFEQQQESKKYNQQKSNKKIPINLNFKVLKQKAVDFSFLSTKEMLKFPVHEHYLREIQEIYVVYQYKPGADFSKENYITLLLKKLKAKYNAYSVVYLGEIINETKIL